MRQSVVFWDVSKPELVPVAAAMAATGLALATNSEAFAGVMEGSGLSVKRLASALSPASVARARAAAAALRGALRAQPAADALEAALRSSRGPLLGLLEPGLAARVAGLALEQLLGLEAFERLSESTEVALVMLGCDNGHVQRAIVGAARRRGIPTLQLAHGLVSPPRCGRVAGEMYEAFSDHVAVFGPRARRLLEQAGVRGERLHETGDPALTALRQAAVPVSRAAARTALGLDPERPVVALLTSYSDGASLLFARDLRQRLAFHRELAAALAFGGARARLIVRPHPSELGRARQDPRALAALRQGFARYWSALGLEDALLEEQSKLQALRAADVVIVEGESSVCAEVMAVERPVFACCPPGERSIYSSADGLCVAGPGELSVPLRSALASPAERAAQLRRQQRALPEFFAELDGDPCARIAELALGLAKPRSRVGSARARLDAPPALPPGGLRILEVVHGFPPFARGGTELYTERLAQELRRRGHAVTVAHPRLRPDRPHGELRLREHEGLPVIELSRRDLPLTGVGEFLDPALEAPFAQILREGRFDLVHVQHLLWLSSSLIDVAKRAGLPVALKLDDLYFTCARHHRVRGDETYCATGADSLDRCFACTVGRWPALDPSAVASGFGWLAARRAVLHRALGQVDFVQCASEFIRSDLLAHGFPSGCAQVVRTGIAPFAALARSAAPGGRPRIGFLGAIHRRKGIQIFLEAIARFRRGSLRDALAFSVHGGSSGDRALDRALSLAAARGDVTHAGAFGADDRARVFAALDLVVLPSLGENYPFVLREALHAGVPVAASQVAGVPEIVSPDQNGFLLPPGDAGALAALFTRIAGERTLLATLRCDAPIRTLQQEVDELEPCLRALARPFARTAA